MSGTTRRGTSSHASGLKLLSARHCEQLAVNHDFLAGAVVQSGPGSRVIQQAQPDENKAREHEVRGVMFLTQPSAAQLAEIARLVETEELNPHISATFPLEQAAQAQEKLERERSRGTIVLEVA